MTPYTKVDCKYYCKFIENEYCFCFKKSDELLCSKNFPCLYYEKIEKDEREEYLK